MKYHPADQLRLIAELEAKARAAYSQAMDALNEADVLASEVKETYGSRFMCDGVVYKLEHRATGYRAGNRNWLVRDTDVRVMQ